ncbi:MAG: hypothetical protein OXC07_12090 [Kistimonas sp.]|nr:hypothetical protein [Kistimonas sp.]
MRNGADCGADAALHDALLLPDYPFLPGTGFHLLTLSALYTSALLHPGWNSVYHQ